MDRRQFVAAAGAASLAGLVAGRRALAAAAPGSADARLDALFARIFDDTVDNAPEFATGLGLDKGPRSPLKSRLGDGSAQGSRDDLARNRKWLAALEAFPVAGLTPAGALNREVVLYSARARVEAPEKYGIDSAIRPYRIFQQGGAYYSVPDFLNDTHTIATAADCEAYLARLAALATALDQDSAVQAAQAARGFLAPGFALDLTIGQMKRLRATPAADSNLARSLATRAAAKGIAGDWGPRAAGIVDAQVYPALDRQIALIERLRPTTAAGDGVWRIAGAPGLYATALAQATTTTMTPDEVHATGLAQVTEITAQLDTILKAQGMTRGTVAERLSALNTAPDQLYPDTPEGRRQLIAALNAGVRAMEALLPRDFATLPGAPLEIRAVPAEIQDGASNGYYKRAALDGSRPAIYFINLKDVRDWPKYSLPSLTYHEGVPGHHLQISIAQQSRDIPTLRKIGFFGAYTEGWALYAEGLADELGGYATPLERAGYLQSFLFRAARLVVDTGIHTERWSRGKATDYLVATTGFPRPRAQREVERYCTQPGQACSYKIGHMAWTRARAAAERMPGFDIKRFHEVLRDGAMPLTLLERVSAERMRPG